jgi:hypothetical protein
MVESHFLRPTGFLVTAVASLPLLAVVNIVAGVAVIAPGRKIFFIERAPMTGGTDEIGMFAS